MKKFLIILLCAGTVLSSCKKTIEEMRPSGSINEETVFQTVNDLEAATLGAYSGISGENIIYVAAIMSDEVTISSENRGQGQFLHKWTHTSGDGDAARAWNNLYIPIDRANRVLEAMESVPNKAPTDAATKDRIKGELLAIRAWAHFELWRWYAPMPYSPNALGIPYATESVSKSGIKQPARETSSSNFSKIEADLAQAKTLIGTYNGGSFGIGRITRPAISAIQARVALYKGDWTNAITYAGEVIAAVPLATRTNFPSIWLDVNDNEVVWELKRTTQAVNTLWRDTNGDIFFQPSNKLVYAYDSTGDVRFPAFIRRVRPGIGGDVDDTVTVNKYPGKAGATQTNDIKMFRTAEMYLIRAEARAENNDLVGAALDVKTLRDARLSTPSVVAYATKQEAIDSIYHERFLELAFEGHRYFDLKRRALPIVRDSRDAAAEYRTLQPSNFLYLFPFPQNEILANPNIVQNPGYQN